MNTQTFIEKAMNLTEKKEWRFKHRGVECEVIFWSTEHMKDPQYNHIYQHGGIWKSYFFLRKEYLGDAFDVFKKRRIGFYIGDSKKKHYRYEYGDIDDVAEMNGGITFYELSRDVAGDVMGVKIGNDYNHIWNHNHIYDEEIVAEDLKESVDKVLDWLKIKTLKNDYIQ